MNFEEEKKDDPESSLNKTYPPEIMNEIAIKIQNVIFIYIGRKNIPLF